MPTRAAELEIARHQNELILEFVEYHIFCAPGNALMPEKLTEGATSLLTELPANAGWADFGLMDKDDAVTRTRSFDKSGINAIGYRDPVRSRITSDVTSLQFSGLETNRQNIEKWLNVDLSGVTPDPVTGEVRFKSIPAPPIRNRYFGIGRSGVGPDMIYIGILFSAGEVEEVDDQTITDGEDAFKWPMTVNSYVDTNVGWSVEHFFGGPGWKAKLEDAGFDASGVAA
jgi:hypothetical protein